MSTKDFVRPLDRNYDEPRELDNEEKYQIDYCWEGLKSAIEREKRGDIIKEVHIFRGVKLYGFKREK